MKRKANNTEHALVGRPVAVEEVGGEAQGVDVGDGVVGLVLPVHAATTRAATSRMGNSVRMLFIRSVMIVGAKIAKRAGSGKEFTKQKERMGKDSRISES